MRLFAFFFAAFICLVSFAQTDRLDYYQHIKTVYSNGNVQTQSGQNGQFVRRTHLNGNKRCYDATSSGLNHLNGTLCFSGYQGGNEVYEGPSYWGHATYQFDDNRGYLNVKDSRGTVYVFRRSAAPAGKRHSSYLVKGASVDGWDDVAEWNKIHDASRNYDSNGNSSSKSKKSKTTTKRSSSSGGCGYCHGSKRVKAHTGTGSYGVRNKKVKCPTCGEVYDPANDHWHACPHCK